MCTCRTRTESASRSYFRCGTSHGDAVEDLARARDPWRAELLLVRQPADATRTELALELHREGVEKHSASRFDRAQRERGWVRVVVQRVQCRKRLAEPGRQVGGRRAVLCWAG